MIKKRHETPEEDKDDFRRKGVDRKEYSAYWAVYWKGGGSGTRPRRETWKDGQESWLVRDKLGRFVTRKRI